MNGTLANECFARASRLNHSPVTAPARLANVHFERKLIMLAETVISIIETSTSDAIISRFLGMTAAEYAAYAKTQAAHAFFRNVAADTAAWVARIRKFKLAQDVMYLKYLVESFSYDFAFQSAMAKLAAEEAFVAHSARIAALNAAAAAAEGTLVVGTGTIVVVAVVPVVAMVAVAAALGAPYYQARQAAKKEEYASGFARGFVTGLLQWEARFTIDRFWDNGFGKNGFDESMPALRAAAHNEGLIKGRVAGLAKNDQEKKAYLKGLAKLSKASSSGWNSKSNDPAERMRARRVQIGYVIDLAAAARKHGIVAVE
jgi:hypothetical protein